MFVAQYTTISRYLDVYTIIYKGTNQEKAMGYSNFVPLVLNFAFIYIQLYSIQVLYVIAFNRFLLLLLILMKMLIQHRLKLRIRFVAI